MAKLITLDNLQQFLTKGDGHWLVRGDYDGSTGVGYAELANNLVATKGLTVNDDPMSYGIVGGAQKSAVGDGNASLNKLVCVNVVKNQKTTRNTDLFPMTSNGVTLSVKTGDSGINAALVINGTASDDGGFSYISSTSNLVVGHKYLMFACPSGGGADKYWAFNYMNGTVYEYGNGTIFTASNIESATYTNLRFGFKSGQSFNNVEIKPIFIDLTQRYGNNDVVNAIIGTGTDAEKVARLLAFDPEILNDTSYNAGTLVPSKTAKLLDTGYNLLKDDWTVTGNNAQYIEKTLTKPIVCTGQVIALVATVSGAISPMASLYNGDSQVAEFFLNQTAPNGQKYGRGKWPDNNYALPIGTKITKIRFRYDGNGGTSGNFTYSKIAIFQYLDGADIGFKPYKEHPVALPNYEGHGILKVVEGKVVADGTELYPDGNSKKRYGVVDLGTLDYATDPQYPNVFSGSNLPNNAKTNAYGGDLSIICAEYEAIKPTYRASVNNMQICQVPGNRGITIKNTSYKTAAAFKTAMSGKYLVYELTAEEDITTPAYQSTFPVEQGGTLQFLDEDDNPIAGLQGSEIFYQKNIKAFVEAFGEAIGWDPARIERLANLSFTPEYTNITLNPSPTGAYARAQVYNATFTIVISAALTGTANGSITFQDSEVDLSNFQTKPADSIYDMDGKKVSEAPTTPDCNIASFVGRSKSGIVLWSLLHSGVNKVKIHIEEPVPLDSEGNGKIDCRASLIL